MSFNSTTQDAVNWTDENPDIEIAETTIVSISERVSQWAIVINNDVFSDTHYIFVMRDNEARFIISKDILDTDMIWSYESQSWTDIYLLEKIEASHAVISIDTEPYDVFFTENMLVHDSHKIEEE